MSDEIKARNLLALAAAEADKRVLDSAYDHATQALQLAQRAGESEHDGVHDAQRMIAFILFTRGDSNQAEPILRRLVGADRNDGESQRAGDDLQLYASVLGELARYELAENAFRDAIRIYRKLHGDSHSTVGNTYSELGLMLLHKGDLGGAEESLRSAFEIAVRLYGAQTQPVWSTQSNLLRVMEMKGQFAEVLPQRLRMMEQEEKVLGKTRPDGLAYHMNLIGSDYRELGQLDNATLAYRRALSIWAGIQGANTEANSATPMIQLGSALVMMGRYQEAESTLRSALAIQTKHELPSSQWLNLTRGELGNLLRLQHRMPEALQELNQAIAALSAVPENPGSQANAVLSTLQARLAETQLDSGSIAAAHETAINALGLARTSLPRRNFRLGTSLFALARTELAIGRPDEAESLLREALSVRSPPHPDNDFRVLEVKVSLVAALAALGRYTESRAIADEAALALNASSSPYAIDLRARLERW